MMLRPGWKHFTCEGKVWHAHRRSGSGSSSKEGFTGGSGRSGIEFVTDGGEQHFLKMAQPDVPRQEELNLKTDAQLCELLAKAVAARI